MLRRWTILLFLLAFSYFSKAQEGIGYFYDYTNHLNVFDKGTTYDIENSRVTNIKTGLDYLAYIDSKNSLEVYYNGDKTTLEEFPPTTMVATPHALIYKSRNRLMVFENGRKRLLSKFAGDYYADDSIVIWQSQTDLNIMAYRNGEIKVVELSVSTSVINDCKIGPGIFAFNTVSYDFMIYYNDQVYETGSSRISDYECGRDVVAFTDVYNNTFNVFYKGNIKTISTKLPKNFMVSDETVVFIDADDNFNIYYKGALTKIDSYGPEYFYTVNNVIYYCYNSRLKMIYDGKISTDQLIRKENIIAGRNSLLYSTESNTPIFYYRGKISPGLYVPKPYQMELHGDLPVFIYGNTMAFYYNGKMEEFGIRK